ncbi:hypothetical protein CMQ_4433 [Grosmannia clavigera kw1407]|uniref:Uncharacterized protein n=1 Tax=Grosmannia clavigera (strain kw1407 / UAMH 11150) TaxID=655863 RepID=F0XU39_GROCL|nr:uncharacterized protein CMQ_4433 [Grosmannia clavigera kw1407]EFW98581.1 hypothetical protein CMQ_4433 [Grosmannia clavigera kw1407]
MAPLRRYLRITKYSVLECRIYLDNPALAQSWLLHPRDPVLPRVLESIRPLVLPKLVEERERARKKGAKNKGVIKDVLVEDDFEVSLFLTETETRHSLLRKHRKARDKTQTRLVSNSTRLTGASLDTPVDVDAVPPTLLRQDSDDEAPAAVLQNIPAIAAVPAGSEDGEVAGTRRSKRQRQVAVQVDDSEDEGDDDDDDDDGKSDHSDHSGTDRPPAKRSRAKTTENGPDSKKEKLAMDVLYEGFAIYGRVLCLVIKKRTPAAISINNKNTTAKTKSRSTGPTGASTAAARPAGLAAMENWIASTQAVPEAMEADVP